MSLLPSSGLFKLSVLHLPYSVSHLFVFSVSSSISSSHTHSVDNISSMRTGLLTCGLCVSTHLTLPEAWQSLFSVISVEMKGEFCAFKDAAV